MMNLTQLINIGVLLLLASTGLLVVNRRLSLAIVLIAFQSMLLASIAALVALASGIEHLYLASGLTILIKVLLGSFVLGYVLRTASTRVESKVIGRGLSLSICIGLVLVSYSVVQSVKLPHVITSPYSLMVAISMVLLGLFLIVSRKKALMHAIGLLTIENGLFLIALSATYGMPLLVEVGIFLDVGLSVILLGTLTLGMNRVFDSMDTTGLRNLKG